MIKLFMMILLISPKLAFSFNWDKCKDLYPDPRKSMSWQSVAVGNVLSGISSTSQFISSTGSCAALGSNEEQRHYYYAVNFNYIQVDVARGGGENINGLLTVFGCNERQKDNLRLTFKRKYQFYFESSAPWFEKKVFDTIGKICMAGVV